MKLAWEILGIPEGSDQETIRIAFKSKALKFHPDQNPNEKDIASSMMTALNLSYNIVMKVTEVKLHKKEDDKSENGISIYGTRLWTRLEIIILKTMSSHGIKFLDPLNDYDFLTLTNIFAKKFKFKEKTRLTRREIDSLERILNILGIP